MEIEEIARLCHEANAVYCRSIGDMSQPDWLNAPEWQRSSAINGVKFHLNNPDKGAEASHESWYAEKERDGWLYGPVKDPVKKRHPCFVAFKELPVEQQIKDHIFRSIVHGCALAFGGVH